MFQVVIEAEDVSSLLHLKRTGRRRSKSKYFESQTKVLAGWDWTMPAISSQQQAGPDLVVSGAGSGGSHLSEGLTNILAKKGMKSKN